jgi:hypothetical protein
MIEHVPFIKTNGVQLVATCPLCNKPVYQPENPADAWIPAVAALRAHLKKNCKSNPVHQHHAEDDED